MKCKYCYNNDVVKHGKQNGNQRYYCHSCYRTFIIDGKVNEDRKKLIRGVLCLLLEGYKAGEVSEYYGISYNTVNNWKNKYFRKLKELLPSSQPISNISNFSVSFKNKKRPPIMRFKK